jgi:hypothetical protein
VVGAWWITAVGLAADPGRPPTAAASAQQLTVTWPDGRVTTCTLPDQH